MEQRASPLGIRKMFWLGGRDSNPDSQIQSLESYHWTTSQRRIRIYGSLTFKSTQPFNGSIAHGPAVPFKRAVRSRVLESASVDQTVSSEIRVLSFRY